MLEAHYYPFWHEVNFRELVREKSVIFGERIIMEEVIFVVKESPEGGYEAQALGSSIFTEADTWEMLREEVKDAVRCHFDDDQQRIIRLHYVKEKIIAA